MFGWNFSRGGGVGQNSFGSGGIRQNSLKSGQDCSEFLQGWGLGHISFGSGCNWSKFLQELEESVNISAKVGGLGRIPFGEGVMVRILSVVKD